MPIPVVVRSKELVQSRSNTGFAVSVPVDSMTFRLFCCCVLCRWRRLRADDLYKGVVPSGVCVCVCVLFRNLNSEVA